MAWCGVTGVGRAVEIGDGAFRRREAKGEGVWGAVCFSGGPRPFIGPRREGEAVVQRLVSGWH
jgi:hypothetical protein